MNAARRFFDLRFWIVAPLLLVWLAASVLILIGQGDVESILGSAFGRHTRPDAFERLNRIAVPFWVSHSVLASLSILAAWHRRVDILLVLLIGPAIALLICVSTQQWSDPNWYVMLAVCSIGWLVGGLVTGCYWFANRRRRMDD
jgi:hypothetical protein